jgi:hypothetical protein
LEEALGAYKEIGNKRGIVLITACTGDQTAREKIEWGGGHGALSWSILECMQKKGEKIVTLNRLCYLTTERMQDLVGRKQAVVVQNSADLPWRHIPIAIAP